jgi:Ca2+-binding EF-hand superfamily protein
MTCVVAAVVWCARVDAQPLFHTPNERAAALFAKADRDGNRRLSLDEFIASQAQADVARRDYLLFDLDANGALSLDEFSACPTVLPARERGPLYDPMQGLVDQALAALDETMNRWNERPDDTVEQRVFMTSFIGSSRKIGMKWDLAEFDPDRDGQVTRAEALRFLEIQLGVRRAHDQPLRRSDGRVVNYMLYLHADQNKNDRLERQEFVDRTFGGAEAVQQFTQADSDGDGSVSFEEWCTVPGRSHEDPIEHFRQYDTNLDAYLDPDELQTGLPEWKRPLGKLCFPGFDLDKDGRLSLTEYRLSMPANMVLPWHAIAQDKNEDERITLDEFDFADLRFPVLRLVFFHRLDLNQDGALDPSEYPIHKKTPDEFFVMNADGTGWRPLFRFEPFAACGSPAVSPDGKWIAFDAWRSRQERNPAIFVMPVSGGDPKSLRSGMMPSWSNDGGELCYSWNNSVWITKVDAGRLRIATQGWGGQWSPDGKTIAFADGNLIKLYDVKTDKNRTLLGAEGNPYMQVYWNMGWSPNSARLCFKAEKNDRTQEVALVNVAGQPELKVVHSDTVAINADFAWHPAGDRVVFARHNRERGRMQLYEFNPNQPDWPRLVEGQDPERNLTDACWTPDGKRLIVIAGDY